MSLNTAHTNGNVWIYNGEYILLFCDGVELQFEGDDAKAFHGSKKGRIYLTTHRMIFTNKNRQDYLQSFSFPFYTITSIELEQPIFGANYIKGKVKAETGGNWNGQAVFKLKFLTGGAIEFGQAMLQAAKLASRNMPAEPPPYIPPSGPYYPAAPPAYTPPQQGYYGFVPPVHVFPNAPPPNSVYTTDMPPPYPGINATAGMPNGNPPAAGFVNAGGFVNPDPKAQEAAQQQAFYNPYNPGYAYVPQSAPPYASTMQNSAPPYASPVQNPTPTPPYASPLQNNHGPPPSYYDATKKQQ